MYHHNPSKSINPELCVILQKADYHSSKECIGLDDESVMPLTSIFSRISFDDETGDDHYVPLVKLDFNKPLHAQNKDVMSEWDLVQKYEDILYQILREGEKLGILMIITVESFSGMNISMRLSDLLKTRICFYMKDTYSYTEAFNIIQIPVLPKKGIPGRGIAYYGERILEFQTALAVKEQNDYRRQEKIRQILDRRVAV